MTFKEAFTISLNHLFRPLFLELSRIIIGLRVFFLYSSVLVMASKALPFLGHYNSSSLNTTQEEEHS